MDTILPAVGHRDGSGRGPSRSTPTIRRNREAQSVPIRAAINTWANGSDSSARNRCTGGQKVRDKERRPLGIKKDVRNRLIHCPCGRQGHRGNPWGAQPTNGEIRGYQMEPGPEASRGNRVSEGPQETHYRVGYGGPAGGIPEHGSRRTPVGGGGLE